jgi:formylmethanofuran dehydrogenase subunit B
MIVHFEPFALSPFEFTKSNEDTLKQLFAKIKEKEVILIFSLLHVNRWKKLYPKTFRLL